MQTEVVLDSTPYIQEPSCMAQYVSMYTNHMYDKKIIVKRVRTGTLELQFHKDMTGVYKDQQIFVIPLNITRYPPMLIFPFAGQDLLKLADLGFWTDYEQITLSNAEELMKKLYLFHRMYKMAIGDIKPENIVYDPTTGVGKFIDLEYVTRQYHPPRSTDSVASTLSIDIPDPFLRHYRTVTTPAYSCFEKRHMQDYDVFKNDEYALATTLYCIITNRQPPGGVLIMERATIVTDKLVWDYVHEKAYEYLAIHLRHTLQWGEDNTAAMLKYVRQKWSQVCHLLPHK